MSLPCISEGQSRPTGSPQPQLLPDTVEQESKALANHSPPVPAVCRSSSTAAHMRTKLHDVPFSIFTPSEKRLIALGAGVCAVFSPVSGQIYYPALNAISEDLHKSHDLINLTITVYLIVQGLAPAFVGGYSDNAGRRPAYMMCLAVYIASNVGLALQSNYAALMALRCLQSAGGSGTVALGTAVVSDIVTLKERGRYVSYVSIPAQAGPALGPIIGGLLAQYLGWHAIFWFLLAVAGAVTVPFLLFFPETCRKVVGNGNIPPPAWDRCLLNSRLQNRLASIKDDERQDTTTFAAANANSASRRLSPRRRVLPNPFTTIRIIFTKEAGFALGYIAIVCCAYYATVALIPSQFGKVYGLNEIQIALCYIPMGTGSLIAAVVRGRIIDARYRHYAGKLDTPLDDLGQQQQQQQQQHVRTTNGVRDSVTPAFPIERARLEVALPTLALGSASIIGFGWMIQCSVHLAGPLILLFVTGFCTSASMNTVSVLLVDIFPGKAGAATAANNMCRCWLGAASTAAVVPMTNKVGAGWTITFFGCLIPIFSPILFYIMQNGPPWRRATVEKREAARCKA